MTTVGVYTPNHFSKWIFPFAVSRETFRTLGEYVITKEDFLQAADFHDRIYTASNYIDTYDEEFRCKVGFLPEEDLLSKVPFRALIPKGSSRILVTVRIVLADRIAFAGICVQCTLHGYRASNGSSGNPCGSERPVIATTKQSRHCSCYQRAWSSTCLK